MPPPPFPALPCATCPATVPPRRRRGLPTRHTAWYDDAGRLHHPTRLAQDCYEAYNIQVSGLEQRLRAIGGGSVERMPKIVIGVSGGLDSTHALIVAAKACDRLGLPRTHVLAFTLPGFATSEHTRTNATALSEALGVTFETIDITAVATQLLRDLGHPAGRGEPAYDVTFENVQAGVRTDLLFRAANQRGGIVLGLSLIHISEPTRPY